jgi:hypothetical protein
LVGAEYDALKTGTNSKKRPKVYRPAVSFNDNLRDHRAGRAFLWPDHSYGLMKLRKKKSETQVMDFGFEF